jgi:hypothetical protein
MEMAEGVVMLTKVVHRESAQYGDAPQVSSAAKKCGGANHDGIPEVLPKLACSSAKLHSISDILAEWNRFSGRAQNPAAMPHITHLSKATAVISPGNNNEMQGQLSPRSLLTSGRDYSHQTQQHALEDVRSARAHKWDYQQQFDSMHDQGFSPPSEVLSERLLHLRNARRRIESELVKLGIQIDTAAISGPSEARPHSASADPEHSIGAVEARMDESPKASNARLHAGRK